MSARLRVPCGNLPPPFPSGFLPPLSLLSSSQSSSSHPLRPIQLHLNCALGRPHHGTDSFAHHHPLDISVLIHIEHHDLHAVIHAQSNRRRIHHLQILMQHIAI